MTKAARALLGWDQGGFADAAGLSKSTIGAFESKDETARMTIMNNKAAVEAFERAGLEFIPENGGGVGIRFRNRADGTRQED